MSPTKIKDLASLDAFLATGTELDDKWAGDTSLKDAASFAFLTQSFLIHSFIFEARIVMNNFPEFQECHDQGVVFYQSDLKDIRGSMGYLRDMVMVPSVRLEEDKAKEELKSVQKVDADVKIRVEHNGKELQDMKEILDEFKRMAGDQKGGKSRALSSNQRSEVERLCQKFVALVSLIDLTQKQLKDVRNIAFHDKGKEMPYHTEFEWKGKSSDQSKGEMDARKEELGKRFDAYVNMPVVDEPQE